MANITPVSPATFDDVYQIETTDLVLGGAGQIANRQAQSLVNRTQYLKDKVDDMPTTSEELENKTIDSKKNTMLNTPTWYANDKTLTASDVAKETAIGLNPVSDKLLTIGNIVAPYLGYTFPIIASTDYANVRFTSVWNKDVVLSIQAGQSIVMHYSWNNQWTIISGQSFYIPASKTISDIKVNDWRKIIGKGTNSFFYNYTGASSDYGLPTDKCCVEVTWNRESPNVAIAKAINCEEGVKKVWIKNLNIGGWDSNWTELTSKNGTQELTNKTIDANSNNLVNVVTSKSISNCITEIPQDINLTLSSGTLTLKSGSKVYIPKEGGTFDVYTVPEDKTVTSTDNAVQMICVQGSGSGKGNLLVRRLSNCVSGAGATVVAGFAYNTTTNQIRGYNAEGTDFGVNYSFPICIVTVSGGAITSIDQVFNGIGYIGSTLFVLPGVKALRTDGRNTDGTLKSAVFSTTNVLTTTETSNGDKIIFATGASSIGVGISSAYKYNEETNYWLTSSSKVQWCELGRLTTESLKISNFTPRTAFHAMDYSNPVLQDKIIDYGDVVGGNKLKCTTTVISDNVTLNPAYEMNIQLNTVGKTLTLGSAPYIGYKLNIMSTVDYVVVAFRNSAGSNVSIALNGGQSIEFVSNTTTNWSVISGATISVRSTTPSTYNDWRTFIGIGTYHYLYDNSSAASNYSLPENATAVTVVWNGSIRASATAVKWGNISTPATVWTRGMYSGTWGSWYEQTNNTGTQTLTNKTINAGDNTLPNITNCITKIPQDIIISYETTKLTVASGTKVYDALGNSWTISSNTTRDFSNVAPSSTNKWIIVFEKNSNSNHVYEIGRMWSQPTQPSSGGIWLNTNTKEIKWSNDAVTWGDCSFPIGIISTDNDRVIQNVQIFNGVGFIGKKLFTLPGVKYLTPNGRNSDGTLRSVERIVSTPWISSLETTTTVAIWLSGGSGAERVNVDSYTYDEKLNIYYVTGDITQTRAVVRAGTITLDGSGNINSMNLYTPFRAVDYNEPTVEMVVTFSDNTTATYNVRIKE